MTLDLNRNMILRFIKKYTVLILLFGVMLGCANVFFNVEERGFKYSSDSSLVQNDNNYNLVTAYVQFVSSARFEKLMNTQIAQSNWSKKEYKKDYSVALTANGDNSPFFSIKITAANKDYAKYLAQIATKLFMTNVGKYLSGANMSVLSDSSTPTVVGAKSKILKSAIMGMLVGIIVAFLFSLWHMLYVGRLTDNKYIQDVYQIKLLGDLEITNDQDSMTD